MSKDFFENYIRKIVNGDSFEKEKVEDKIAPKPNASVINSTRSEVYDLAINNGNVIIPGIGIFKTNVGIKNGIIATITNTLLSANQIIDARDKYVSPGVIDPHVHLGLFAPFEEEVVTETKAALAGGVTTLGCYFASKDSHFNTFPGITEKIEALSNTDIIPHLIINNDVQKQEINDYVSRFFVTSFKLYMNGVPGIMPDVDDAYILDVFEKIKKNDKKCIVCVHAENRDIVRRATAMIKEEMADMARLTDWSRTHPEMAEEEAAMRISYLAKKTEVDIYLVHISSADAIKSLRGIKQSNKFVNIETTSPYLSLNNKSTRSNIIKMEPPIRSAMDVEELWTGIIDGTIDTVGTDNVTMTVGEKNLSSTNIWNVMPGYPATETHLPVLLNEGVVKRSIPIEKIIEKVTKRPAEIFGVYPRKGSMMIGSDADITIIDLNKAKVINAGTLHSRSDFSIYEGKTLQGWPVTTIKSGKIVYDNDRFTGEKAKCNYLKR
ncbi:MAG: amidohydrolase family protein [Firmicutes bacterium]|nr:amidohydrolase family protein [Bacillota bacterium]